MPAGDRPVDRFDVRDRLTRLVRQHAWSAARVFSADPSLLANETYVAGYPAIERFLADHPEVRSDPSFYAAGLDDQPINDRGLSGFLEGLTVFAVFGVIALALSWLLRTVIEQKRWSRLSQTQSEVHNKILDRFTATDELLEYIRTPAGSRFLESAPIPLHESRPLQDPPVARVLWSIQIGVVAASAALGLLFVSYRYEAETAERLFSLGVVILSLGVGFVASAAASIFLSRRIGLLTPPPATGPSTSDRLVDSGP
jgi:hypothetical protein